MITRRLLLIRHAQSQANALGIIQGCLDYPLSDDGHQHAQYLCRRLAKEFSITKIFTSPLSRAVQTATYLSRELNLPLLYNTNLKERDLGPLSGLHKKDVHAKFPEVEQAWRKNMPRPQLDGMENDQTFARRVQRAVDAIMAQTEPDSTVAVFSHSGTLAQMLKNWMGITHTGQLTFAFSNTSLSIVDAYATVFRIVMLNDTTHLQKRDNYVERTPAHPPLYHSQ